MSHQLPFRQSLVLAVVGGLCLSVGPVAASTDAPSPSAVAVPDADEVSVVVELEGAPSLDALEGARGSRQRARDRATTLEGDHRRFVATAEDRGIEVRQEAAYSNVLNGVALSVAPHDLSALRALPGVREVHRNTQYRATLADAVPHVGAPRMWSRLDQEGVPVKGAGQTVAVLDTGIDYHHLDLGGCFGRGCRVVDGYDFVNGDADPDDDNFHGTHVAGIIGAAGEVTGIAPEVRFEAYKVLDRNGFGSLADILAGLDAATDPFNLERPSVINMSLGDPSGDGTDLLSQAVQQASEAHFTVVTSAGNTGPDPHTIGAPASAPGALTVGASTTGVVVPDAQVVVPRPYDLKDSRLGFSATLQPGTTRLDVVDVGQGTPADYEGVDVTGKLVLVGSGDSPSSWFQDGITAEEHGAAAAFIVPPDPSEPFGAAARDPQTGHQWSVGTLASGDDGRLDSLVAMQIPGSAASDLRGFLAEGATAVEITATDATDTIPAFSSRGPSGLVGAKPDLVAPGVEVRSTVPVGMFGGSYGRVSGTSMAAPMVSGAVALLNQLHPQWGPDQVEAALTGSARRLADADPLTQGAGLLDIPAAADTMVTASPRTASLGLADAGPGGIAGSATITLTNSDTTSHEFSLDVHKATGAAADVTVTPSSVRLVSGERRQVTIQVRMADPGEDVDLTGWVTADVDGDRSTDLTIPYALSQQRLEVIATPDPAVRDSQVFVRTPVAVGAPPVVTVSGPRHFRRTFTMTHDHGDWWRVPVDSGAPGLYRAHVTARTTVPYGSVNLAGEATFEVVEQRRKKASWAPVGPYGSGGEMAPSPAGGDDMLVSSDRTASIFRTFDGGGSWEQLSNLPLAGGSGFGAQPVLAADPTSRDRYYVGIDAGFSDPTYQGALLVTDDGGDSWRRLPYPDDRVFEMAVGADGQTLAVVSDDAFYVSTDRGRTWRTLWGPWEYAEGVAIDGDRIYLAAESGLYAYDDVHGDLTGPTFLFNPNTFGGMDAIAAVDGHLFAWPFGSGDPIYESTDAGRTWAVAHTPEPEGFMVARDLKVIDGDVWAISDEGVWVGEDMGASWSAKPTPQDDLVVGDADAFDGAVWTSSDGGLFSTTDQASSYARTGIQGIDVHDLALSSDDEDSSRLVAATTWDTYGTSLGADGRPPSADWGTSEKVGEFDANGYFLSTVPGQPGVLYKVSHGPFGSFHVYRSDDAGVTWTLKLKAEQIPTSFLVHPADPDSLYVGFRYFEEGQGMFISHDGGETWRREPMPREPLALAGDPTDPDRVYAGDLQGFYVSDDAGRHFSRRHTMPTTAISVDPDHPRRVVVGGHRLFRSEDAAASFTPSTYLPVKLNVADIAYGPGKRVYAATSSFYDAGLLKGGRGVLLSRDDGKAFESVSDGLGSLDTLSLAVAPDGRTYVGLRGGGVYTMSP